MCVEQVAEGYLSSSSSQYITLRSGYFISIHDANVFQKL